MSMEGFSLLLKISKQWIPMFFDFDINFLYY